MTLAIAVQRLEHGADLPLPAYATEGSAGCDLLAAVDETILLEPGQRALVPSGIAIALPAGYEAQVRPRSGLAVRHGLTVLNAPGTIDSDYRGEIKALMINLGQESFAVERGSRIAQLVIAPVTQLVWQERASLSESTRGTGGFGSTGLAAEVSRDHRATGR